MRDLIQYKRTKLQLIQKQISNYHYESILTVTKRFIDLYENNNPAELYEILSLDVKYIVPDSWDELFNPTGFDHDLLGISKVAKKISSSIWLNKEWIKDSIPYFEFGPKRVKGVLLALFACNLLVFGQAQKLPLNTHQ